MDTASNLTVKKAKEAQVEDFLPPIDDRVYDPNVLLEFSCAICLHLISDPRQCSFGHNICFKCFQDLARYAHLRCECPTCRAPMDRNTPNRNLVLEKVLATLDVYCRYHFIRTSDTAFEVDDEGCQVHKSRSEIQSHESVCGFAFVPCPHASICGTYRRAFLEGHLEECPNMPLNCEYCRIEVLRKEMELHHAECPDLPLICRHCSKSIAQKRMNKHLERDCEGKTHTCPYREQGCDAEEMAPIQLKRHLEESAAEHLELVQQGTMDALKRMENKFLKMMALKDAEIEELKRASRNRYRFDWNLHWKHIPGDTSTIQAYTSEKFDIFGRKFYLALWPIGEPNRNPDEISSSNPASQIASREPSLTLMSHPPTLQSYSTIISEPGTLPPSGPGSSPTHRFRSYSHSAAPPSSGSGVSAPAPPLGPATRSYSSQLFDRFRRFVSAVPQDSSTPSGTNNDSSQRDSSKSSASGPTTWVAVYLMMEDEQPAPPSATAAPRIYSPVTGLQRQAESSLSTMQMTTGALSTTSHQSQPTQHTQPRLALESQSHSHHDPSRSMNVNLARHLEHGMLPMRPPESMVLEYTLRFMNNSPLLTKSAYFEITFPVPNGNGWGEEKFIETAQISRAGGFLNRNNQLHVQCDIQVRQCTFDV